jgi:NitT/TauT family transport system substrate-binding protein
VTPYEFTRASGFFEAEGLEVEYVYTRGGNAAMQALVGGAVDYAATSFDVALQAFANGADIRRFATTGRLPLFALAVAPGEVEAIASLNDLEGKAVGVSALGNADHTMLLYLLAEAGADPSAVEFAVLGPNLFEALRRGQVVAGMVQEPALTLIVEDGGKVLFNAMDIADSTRLLGGAYEFMGVAYRAEEREERLPQMQKLARALERGLVAQRTAAIPDIRESLPAELLVGGDGARFDEIIARYRESLYPESVAIDVEACERVVNALEIGGVLAPGLDLDTLLDTEVVPA